MQVLVLLTINLHWRGASCNHKRGWLIDHCQLPTAWSDSHPDPKPRGLTLYACESDFCTRARSYYAMLTPGCLACVNVCLYFAQALLKAGAEVNLMSKNWNFQSALHICAEHSRVEIARLLLVYGANVFVRDRAGFTPRDKAKSLEMQELLQEHEGVNGIPCDSLDQEELGWQTRSTKQKSTQVIFFWARVFVFLLVLKMFSVPSTCFFLMTKLLHEYANSSFYWN